MVNMRFSRLILLAFFCTACAGAPNRAPVEERQQPRSEQINVHHVEPGDTLYSIAWRYGLDYRRLAAANKISVPFTIHTGQILRIAEADLPAREIPAVSKKRTKSSEINQSDPPEVRKSRPPEPVYPTQLTWNWPARGKVIQSFSTKGSVNKGIDIKGKLGEPVKSAAPGKVVYSGNGIIGYGNLVIIKHNDKFLSAYAHNHRILVKELEMVAQGQVIAEIGRDGNGDSVLHFEIRRDGKPVNPMQYLPRTQ